MFFLCRKRELGNAATIALCWEFLMAFELLEMLRSAKVEGGKLVLLFHSMFSRIDFRILFFISLKAG